MNAIAKLPNRGWDLFNDFDHLVNGFFGPARLNTVSSENLIPAIDIVETESGYAVRANVPGASKDSLNVSVKEGVLTIEAGSNESHEVKEGDRVIRSERRTGRYVRSLRLGKSVAADKISADYSDGVLTVNIPRAEDVEAKRIEVAVS